MHEMHEMHLLVVDEGIDLESCDDTVKLKRWRCICEDPADNKDKLQIFTWTDVKSALGESRLSLV
jgi:hypothetical protein